MRYAHCRILPYVGAEKPSLKSKNSLGRLGRAAPDCVANAVKKRLPKACDGAPDGRGLKAGPAQKKAAQAGGPSVRSPLPIAVRGQRNLARCPRKWLPPFGPGLELSHSRRGGLPKPGPPSWAVR